MQASNTNMFNPHITITIVSMKAMAIHTELVELVQLSRGSDHAQLERPGLSSVGQCHRQLNIQDWLLSGLAQPASL